MASSKVIKIAIYTILQYLTSSADHIQNCYQIGLREINNLFTRKIDGIGKYFGGIDDIGDLNF